MSAQTSNIKIYIELSLYQSLSVYLYHYLSLYTVTICLLSARVIKHTIDKTNMLSINSNYKLFPHCFVSSVQHLTEKPRTKSQLLHFTHYYFTLLFLCTRSLLLSFTPRHQAHTHTQSRTPSCRPLFERLGSFVNIYTLHIATPTYKTLKQ